MNNFKVLIFIFIYTYTSGVLSIEPEDLLGGWHCAWKCGMVNSNGHLDYRGTSYIHIEHIQSNKVIGTIKYDRSEVGKIKGKLGCHGGAPKTTFHPK